MKLAILVVYLYLVKLAILVVYLYLCEVGNPGSISVPLIYTFNAACIQRASREFSTREIVGVRERHTQREKEREKERTNRDI